jgi:5-methylcytosine-specific restriction endonuclease McrA
MKPSNSEDPGVQRAKLPWFRMHAEFVDDPKVQRLSPDLFKFWVNCLGLACQNSGYLPSIPDISWKMKIPEKRVAACIASLHEVKLLDQEGHTFTPHNWAARQYISDTSLERVREYRKRIKDSGSTTTAYLKHRNAVMERDGFACVYCEATEKLCLDHSVPVFLGGDDEPENLMTACKRCNSGKAGRTPEMAGMTFAKLKSSRIYAANLERLRNAGKVTVTVSPNGTVTLSPVTVSVTPPDTDTDTDTEKSTPCAASAAPEPAPGTLFAVDGQEQRAPKDSWILEQHNRWYAAYWNHTDRKASLAAYKKRIKALVSGKGMSPEAAVEFLFNSSVLYKQRFENAESWSWRKNLHPATWLNGERWEDECSEADARASPDKFVYKSTRDSMSERAQEFMDD